MNDAMKAALLERAKREKSKRASQQDRGFWHTVGDNVIGFDDGVESPGEKLGNYVRGTTAAVARGMADVPALPVNIAQLGMAGYDKVANGGEPSAASRFLESLPDTRDMLAKVPIIGPESQYKAPGKAGEYISTAGEFAGAAGAAAGPKAMLRYGVAPGVASEAAGQATEGTAVEPYARIAAAILTPAAMARKLPSGNIPGRDAARIKSANTLQKAGVTPSAGQATGSDMLRRMEGLADPTARLLDDFTAASMKMIGSTAKTTRPENLRAARTAISQRIDNLTDGLDFRVPQQVTASIDDVLRDYNRHVTAGGKTQTLESIADEITALTRQPSSTNAVKLLARWRRDIGKMTTSADEATRDAAHGFRKIIDGLTDKAMIQSGRADDIPALKAARNDYRNYLGIEDAATRAGAEGGRISPVQLNQSVIRTQGRKNYATGSGTDMMELTRAGAEVFRPLPTVSAGGLRAIEGGTMATGAGIGGAATGWNPVGIAAGAAAPMVARGMLKTPAVQNLIKNPAGSLRSSAPLLPGLLGEVSKSR